MRNFLGARGGLSVKKSLITKSGLTVQREFSSHCPLPITRQNQILMASQVVRIARSRDDHFSNSEIELSYVRNAQFASKLMPKSDPEKLPIYAQTATIGQQRRCWDIVNLCINYTLAKGP